MTSWRVVRQDDNGNVYVVAGALDEAGARSLAEQLEARAHKQLYSAERVGEEAPVSPAAGGSSAATPRKS
ncbi:MAG TPA: SPOR domain-containing protein [Kofleriaceae bacterium]|nr:SPOR domain-containing protein [Kofleriaceae bacterium]